MLIAGGVMAFVAISVIQFSDAYFTAESSSPPGAISADRVDIDLERAGDPLLDGANLVPGATRTADQQVTNLDHRAQIVLSATGLEGPLPGVLAVVVRQLAPEPLPDDPAYEGLLADLLDVELITLEEDESATWSIELTWPPDQTDPALVGASTSFEFTWVGISAPDSPTP
jgi:hypothetical protein